MNQIKQNLQQFRQKVYQCFERSRDAAFEVIDAIALSPNARAAVEVSQSGAMKRGYASVYKAIERLKYDANALRLELLQQGQVHGTLEVAGWPVYCLDHTPYPRRSAKTVSDRGYVHGADGQTVGHQYSLIGRVMHAEGSWVGPHECVRIPTASTPTMIGAEQLARLKADLQRPCIVTADSEYSVRAILQQASPNLHLLLRLRGNRVLYRQAPPLADGQSERRKKHGAALKLSAPLPYADAMHTVFGPEGGFARIDIRVFKNVHVAQCPDVNGHAIKVNVYDTQGRKRFKRPLWLFWTGPADLDWRSFWRTYLFRFMVECVHQFSKNDLSWTAARLGYTEREERWSMLVMLAYWQLLLALPMARDAFMPWQKPQPLGRPLTPKRVQRDYWRIWQEIGTPAAPPKPRGYSPGRPRGFKPAPRPRYRVVYKS